MKKIIAGLLLCTLAICTTAATKRALIIGIGDYPQSSGWAKINGDKDIPVVEDMLLSNGFERQNIAVLSNEQATRAGIKEAIAQLTKQSEAGDVVYIHFSGHGQQVCDVDGDETEDGLDEAWIPYDAQAIYQKGKYEGENHILDDELYIWFSGIKKKIGKSGNLVVVADACHSGDGSRGDEDEEEEATRGAFSSKWVEEKLVALKQGGESILIQLTTQIFGNPEPQNKPTATAQPQEVDWLFISACKAYQSNQEYKKAGSLTAALSSMKGQLNTLTYDQLRLKIKDWMSSNLPRAQVPTIDKPASSSQQTLF